MPVKNTLMRILRRKGITNAGFILLRRPIVQMASSRISNTSSLSATNRAWRFSACARCASKRSSREASTQYRISGSRSHRKLHMHKLVHPKRKDIMFHKVWLVRYQQSVSSIRKVRVYYQTHKMLCCKNLYTIQKCTK